jgi:uncharacterized protein (TIGR00251 family)
MALIFNVKVTPSSGKNCWVLDKSGMLKCYVKSQAEQGKANQEIIKNIAKAIGITQDNIAIIAGSQKRRKRIKIDIDISYDRLLELFGIQTQMKLFKN